VIDVRVWGRRRRGTPVSFLSTKVGVPNCGRRTRWGGKATGASTAGCQRVTSGAEGAALNSFWRLRKAVEGGGREVAVATKTKTINGAEEEDDQRVARSA
jgi:hypothetical protein